MSIRVERFSLCTGETLAVYERMIDVTAEGYQISHVSECVNGKAAQYKGYGWRAIEWHGLKFSHVRGQCYLLADNVRVYTRKFHNRKDRKQALEALNSKAKQYRKQKTEILIQLDL